MTNYSHTYRVIALCVFLFLFFINAGCDDEAGTDDNGIGTGDLEIIGTWVANNVDVTTGAVGSGVITTVISNTKSEAHYDMDGDGTDDGTAVSEIIEYNNNEKTMFGRITSHTESSFIGQYVRSEWTLSDNTMENKSYEFSDDLGVAKNSTTVTWGPATYTKQ